jgi:excisionase family DNA binding protein
MTTTTRSELVSLPEAASRLQLHRATVNAMVRDGRITATRIDAHWFITREDLESFAQKYTRPPNSPKGARRKSALPETASNIVELLQDWDSAAVDEIQLVTGLHPGNVRKNLMILRSLGLAERRDDGCWQATALARSVDHVAS